jgi:hypothetical protein
MMVVVFAIKEENAQQQRDKTCANLIELIGQNCHCLVVDKVMGQKYDVSVKRGAPAQGGRGQFSIVLGAWRRAQCKIGSWNHLSALLHCSKLA